MTKHTECGVVFQGSERRTGCQFSFTCDGSLARRPIPAIWDRLRKVAAQALAGYVYTPVGLSTHYHADYVVPYWASSLVKTFTVGRHIFYRINGAYGHPGAFTLAYAGREPDVLARTSAGQLAVAETGAETDTALPAEAVVLAGARPILDHRGQVLQLAGNKDLPAGQKSAALTGKPAGPGSGGRASSDRRWVIGMDGQKAAAAKRPNAAVAADESERSTKPAADKANAPGHVALVEPAP
ncbi:cell wall hydrolase [Novosphingobium aquimarinum]|uniref:cell wall hydrolase n=1 Tax=Novosphingobium aquimarinum TaxID=2682494 RepID=UPI002FC3C7CD